LNRGENSERGHTGSMNLASDESARVIGGRRILPGLRGETRGTQIRGDRDLGHPPS
jgi:hypothetical protein